MFSLHSHSGQFCAHAKDTLEEMVLAAIEKHMPVYAMTEHMPRYEKQDLYPEEDCEPVELSRTFELFYKEASVLRSKYASQIQLLIGFEAEFIRPAFQTHVGEILQDGRFNFDFFIGSLHHVYETPIDFDRPMYEKARDTAGGTDEKLFKAYFDEQYAMLKALEPSVVGHFDLIRLLSDNKNTDFREWPAVWEALTRNLQVIAAYGGLLELNTAALRKGLAEPYPGSEICKVMNDVTSLSL